MADNNSGDNVLDVLIRFRADLDKAIADSKKGVGQISEDAKKGGAALDVAAKAGGGLLSVMKSLAGPVVAFFTAQGIANFIRGMAGAFMDGEAATARLSSVLKLAHGDYEKLKPLIEDAANELAQFGFENNEVNKAVADMTLRNYSLRQSLDIVRAAAKLAVVESISLEDATRQIALAANGVLRPGTALGAVLGDLRSELEKGGDKGKNLAVILGRVEQLGGASAKQMGTLSGMVRLLKTEWAELLEALGESAFGNWLADFVKNTTGGLKAIRDELGLLKRTADEALKADLVDKISDLQGRLKRASEGKSMGNPSSLGAPGMPGIAFARFEDPVKLQKELDAAFVQLKAVQDRLSKKQSEEKAKADQAAADQAAKLAAAEAANRLKLNREAIEKDSFQRAQMEADILENLASKAASDRQQRFQDEIKSTMATGEAKANVLRQFYAKEAELAQQSAASVARIRAEAIKKETERIAKEVGSDAATVKDVATGGATVPSSMEGWFASLPKDKQNLEEVVGWMTRLAESIRKADEAATDAQRVVSRFPQAQKEGVGAAYADLISKQSQDVQRTGTELANRVSIIESQRNVGNIRDREAQRQILDAQSVAANSYKVNLRDLLEVRRQINETPDITDASRVELVRDLNDQIADLNSKITQLTPSLEAVARTSDDVWTGMRLGAQRVQDKIKSFAQITADSMEIVANRLGDGFYDAFQGIINGTKSAGDAFREMAVNMLNDLARLMAQQAAMKMVGGLLGGLFGGAGGGVSGGEVAAAAHGGYAGSSGFFPSFASGGIVGGPVTTGDPYLVRVNGGEGMIHPRAVSWLGGPSTIHAMNRMAVPEPIVRMLRSVSSSLSSVPRFSFADGGVAPVVNLGGASSGNAAPLVIQNLVGIGDSEIERIVSSDANRRAIRAQILTTRTRS